MERSVQGVHGARAPGAARAGRDPDPPPSPDGARPRPAAAATRRGSEPAPGDPPRCVNSSQAFQLAGQPVGSRQATRTIASGNLGGRGMTSTSSDPMHADLDEVLVTERELWLEGPPHELFKRLRRECPVHWTSRMTEFPEEAGYWSVTRAEDIHAVSRDFKTYSSETGRRHRRHGRVPARAVPGDVHRHGPAEARPPEDALPGRASRPKRIAAHEPAIRRDRHRRARPARGARDVRPGHRRGAARRLARDRQLHGDPARGRRDVGAR